MIGAKKVKDQSKETSGKNLNHNSQINIEIIRHINTLSPLVVSIGKNPFRAYPGRNTSKILIPIINPIIPEMPIILGVVHNIHLSISILYPPH